MVLIIINIGFICCPSNSDCISGSGSASWVMHQPSYNFLGLNGHWSLCSTNWSAELVVLFASSLTMQHWALRVVVNLEWPSSSAMSAHIMHQHTSCINT